MPHKKDDSDALVGQAEQGPDLRHLMASVIRLLANRTRVDCPAERQTLQHLLGYLLKHPGMADAPAALAAIRQAAKTCGETLARAASERRDGLH